MAIAKPSFDLLLTLGLLAALSCKYDPHPPNGAQKCAGTDAGKQCPTGYECRAGRCYNTPADASEPGLDAAQASDGPGTGGRDVGTGTDTGTACGGLNRACCANKQCNAIDTVCNESGVCVACGITGRPCCANNVCPGVGSICNAAGNCVVCGSSGYACCANNTCVGSNVVCSADNCVPCGTRNAIHTSVVRPSD